MNSTATTLWTAEQKLGSSNIVLANYGKNKTPVLVSKDDLDLKKEVIKSLIRMPYNNYTVPWKIKNIATKQIFKVRQPINHINIRENKKNTWYDMLNTFNHCDSCTFIFEDFNIFAQLVIEIQSISDLYKFCAKIKNIGSSSNLTNKKDNLFTISIYKLEDFCPVYTKNVEGIGVAVEIVSKEVSIYEKLPYSLYSSYYAFSNYTENIFYLDGVIINEYTSRLSTESFINNVSKVVCKGEKKLENPFTENMVAKTSSSEFTIKLSKNFSTSTSTIVTSSTW